MSKDVIYRQAAIDAVSYSIELCNKALDSMTLGGRDRYAVEVERNSLLKLKDDIKLLPSAQPTLYGYNIEYLELIARVLQKENLPPERIVEVLTDIGRIVAIVKDEFEEELRKAVEQCMI